MTWIVEKMGVGSEIPTTYARLEQGQFRQVFYLGEPLTFPLVKTWYTSKIPGAPAPDAVHSWHVRRYDLQNGRWSDPVANGGAIAGGFGNWTIPSSWGLADVPGYYRVFFERATPIAKWGTAMGGGCFVVVDPAGLPADRPAINVQKGGLNWIQDSAAAAYFGIPMVRSTINSVTNPSADYADIGRDLENLISVRPDVTRTTIAFPNGGNLADPDVLAGIDAAVTHFETAFPELEFVYSWVNEPGGGDGPDQNWIPEYQAFYNAVKAASSAALVAGPALATITRLTMKNYAKFLAAGGGATFDVEAFHTYNRHLGSASLDAAQWDNYEHLHASEPVKPRMITEGGDFYAAENGAGAYWRQARHLLLELLGNNQHRVPNTQYSYFFTGYSGQGDHDPYLINDAGQPSLAVAVLLNLTAQLSDATFDKALYFGRWEDPIMKGNRYLKAGGGQVLAVGTFGRRNPTVRVSVAGPATGLDVVDVLGGTTTAAVENGWADVTIHGGAYISAPPGNILDVVTGDWRYGALRTGRASSSHGSLGLTEIQSIAAPPEGTWADSLVADDNNQGDPNAVPTPRPPSARACWQSAVPITTTAPQWAANTFDGPVGLDGVLVACPRPWQEALTVILHAQVQARIGGTWTTVATVDEDPQVIEWLTGYYDAFDSAYDSGWDDTHVYELRFDRVTADAIRVLIEDADGLSYGGAPSLEAFQAFGLLDYNGNPTTAGLGTTTPHPALQRLLGFDSTVPVPTVGGPRWLGTNAA